MGVPRSGGPRSCFSRPVVRKEVRALADRSGPYHGEKGSEATLVLPTGREGRRRGRRIPASPRFTSFTAKQGSFGGNSPSWVLLRGLRAARRHSSKFQPFSKT